MQGLPSDHDLLDELIRRSGYIWARVDRSWDEDCWPWLGPATPNGYGTISINQPGQRGRSVRAHRAVFMLTFQRPIRPDLTLHHLCFRPICVNPSHLREMTQAENIRASMTGGTGGGAIRERVTKDGVKRYAVLFRESGRQRSRTFGTEEIARQYAAARLLQ